MIFSSVIIAMDKNDFKPSGKWLIGYDAECLVCMSSIQFLFSQDKEDQLYFTALSSELSQSILSEEFNHKDPDTLFLYDGNSLYFKSDAVLKSVSHLSFPWKLIRYLSIIPTFIRDGMYNFIASNRNFFQTDNASCPLPSDALRKRIV